MFCDSAMQTGRVVLSHRVDVEDGDGAVLKTVQFGAAVEVIQ